MDFLYYFFSFQGLGKKRHPERSGIFDPAFIAWCPKKNLTRNDRPLTSTYRQDFQREHTKMQLLIHRPKTSFDQFHTTTYRTSHGTDSPNREFISAMNNDALMLSGQTRLRAAKLKKYRERETVASCLAWYRPKVPAATLHTNYNDSFEGHQTETSPCTVTTEPIPNNNVSPAVESQHNNCSLPEPCPSIPVLAASE